MRETFNPICGQDEVVIMRHAQYGRMRLGRCVKRNLGYVGCATDVLSLMDSRCSGHQSCQISIPDSIFTDVEPCPSPLGSYIEASYDCVKGIFYLLFRYFSLCGSYVSSWLCHDSFSASNCFVGYCCIFCY